MIIGGSVFAHKDIHKYTWTSPDGRYKNQIDHVLINQKWRRSQADVRTRRGADVGSDHQLLIAKLRLKLRKNKKTKGRERPYDVGKLKDQETRLAFQVELQNKYDLLQDDQEMTIANFNTAMRESAENVLGHKKKSKECWIQSDTWRKIDERKDLKKKMNQTRSERIKEQLKAKYSQLDKEVKKQTRSDKREYIEDLATKAETAAKKQDMKTLYRIANEVKGGIQGNRNTSERPKRQHHHE